MTCILSQLLVLVFIMPVCVVFTLMCSCVCSTRVSHIAPSLSSLMTSPVAQTGAGVAAPQAVLQSFQVSETDIVQVLAYSITT